MDKFGNFSKEDAMRIAQSDAGQKLMTILQHSDGTQLQNAIQQASAGNFEQAKNTLSALMSSPEAQALLKELGG